MHSVVVVVVVCSHLSSGSLEDSERAGGVLLFMEEDRTPRSLHTNTREDWTEEGHHLAWTYVCDQLLSERYNAGLCTEFLPRDRGGGGGKLGVCKKEGGGGLNSVSRGRLSQNFTDGGRE